MLIFPYLYKPGFDMKMGFIVKSVLHNFILNYVIFILLCKLKGIANDCLYILNVIIFYLRFVLGRFP